MIRPESQRQVFVDMECSAGGQAIALGQHFSIGWGGFESHSPYREGITVKKYAHLSDLARALSENVMGFGRTSIK